MFEVLSRSIAAWRSTLIGDPSLARGLAEALTADYHCPEVSFANSGLF
jgi:hypothetical protein